MLYRLHWRAIRAPLPQLPDRVAAPACWAATLAPRVHLYVYGHIISYCSWSIRQEMWFCISTAPCRVLYPLMLCKLNITDVLLAKCPVYANRNVPRPLPHLADFSTSDRVHSQRHHWVSYQLNMYSNYGLFD